MTTTLTLGLERITNGFSEELVSSVDEHGAKVEERRYVRRDVNPTIPVPCAAVFDHARVIDFRKNPFWNTDYLIMRYNLDESHPLHLTYRPEDFASD